MVPSPCAEPGPLELLVLQPTPFCNINCSYCYLPDRQSTRRMSPDILEETFRWVFTSGLVRQPFTLLWHAGEPLVMPISFYELANDLLLQYNVDNVPVLQSFQTNATLIDARWCEFILRTGMHLGVSVDGPYFLHDRHRRTRQGRGTLDRVLQGIHLLHQHNVPFEVISVLTADALDYPDELFDFYRENGIRSVAFNVEEIEGPHKTSSLQGAGIPERFRRFLTRFLALAYATEVPLRVREFETSAASVKGRRSQPIGRTQENKPWGIVNVDCEGNFSTFSPELLGIDSPTYGSFSLGNVTRDTVESVSASVRFQRLDEEINRGVELCRASCSYFPFCGGGPPANKYFENGTFASTETVFCKLHKKVCLDVSLTFLEQHAQATEATDSFPQSERAPA